MRKEKLLTAMVGALIFAAAGGIWAASAVEQSLEPVADAAVAAVVDTESAAEYAKPETITVETARATSAVANALMPATFAGVVPSSATMTSALRITNRGPAAGTVTVILLNAATGAQLGTWTSPSIAKYGAIQKSVADIAAAATPALTTAQRTGPFNIALRSTFAPAYQLVVSMAQTGQLSNITACGSRLIDNISILGYVEGPATTGVASAVRVVNTGGASIQPKLTLYNAADGALLGTWTAPSVPSNASVTTTTTAIAAAATPPVASTVAAITVLAQSTRGLRLEHVVTSAGVLSDFTNVCL